MIQCPLVKHLATGKIVFNVTETLQYALSLRLSYRNKAATQSLDRLVL
jgi:hypothetical protein